LIVWGRHEVHAALGQKRVVDPLRAAADVQPAGQRAGRGEAAVDAGRHHLPDAVEPAVELGRAHPRELVRALQRGDGAALPRAHLQHLGRRAEGVGDGRAGLLVLAVRQFPGREDEAAAHGIVGLLQDHVALRVGGHQDHPVGVTRQRRAVVEDHVGLRVEGEGGEVRGA
jgi:hypothetical protein